MVIVEPAATPGYPHVHCPTCEKRFCATCYVPWHERISCQRYRATHPHLKHPDVNSNVLSTLAELGARRCPQCRTPGIKGEGCSHQVCLCGFIFRWNEAELVVAPEDTTAEDPANASRDGDGGEAAQNNDSVSTILTTGDAVRRADYFQIGDQTSPVMCEDDRIVAQRELTEAKKKRSIQD